MLTNVGSVRQATLQNRGTIDFFVFSHGHGCEDFAGLSCIYLSDHSDQSVHVSNKALQDNVAKLKIVNGADWFKSLFGDWGDH